MALEWYVVRIQPRAEYLAASELDRDGHEIFFPCIKSEYASPGHSDRPLFPGYLFIRLDKEKDGWPSFRTAHRVAGWVKFQGSVPTIPDEVINGLARQLDEKHGGDGLWRRFQPGNLVKIVTGVLEGTGEIVEEAKSPTGKTKILLEFMGRMVEVKVPWEALQLAGKPGADVPKSSRRTRGKGRWTRQYRPKEVSSS